MKYQKMKQYIWYTMAVVVLMISKPTLPCDIMIEKIHSQNLAQERAMFVRFNQYFCELYLQEPIENARIEAAFDIEEQAYLQASATTLFFHALLEEQVIGYISCDLMDGYKVRIRQMAIEPDFFDLTLVKELLFAIFTAAPKTKHVSVHCPVVCQEFQKLLVDLGFVKAKPSITPSDSLYEIYELKVHAKCKICDVLYGVDFWDSEPSEQDWSPYDSDIADGYLEDGGDAYPRG